MAKAKEPLAAIPPKALGRLHNDDVTADDNDDNVDDDASRSS